LPPPPSLPPRPPPSPPAPPPPPWNNPILEKAGVVLQIAALRRHVTMLMQRLAYMQKKTSEEFENIGGPGYDPSTDPGAEYINKPLGDMPPPSPPPPPQTPLPPASRHANLFGGPGRLYAGRTSRAEARPPSGAIEVRALVPDDFMQGQPRGDRLSGGMSGADALPGRGNILSESRTGDTAKTGTLRFARARGYRAKDLAARARQERTGPAMLELGTEVAALPGGSQGGTGGSGSGDGGGGGGGGGGTGGGGDGGGAATTAAQQGSSFERRSGWLYEAPPATGHRSCAACARLVHDACKGHPPTSDECAVGCGSLAAVGAECRWPSARVAQQACAAWGACGGFVCWRGDTACAARGAGGVWRLSASASPPVAYRKHARRRTSSTTAGATAAATAAAITDLIYRASTAAAAAAAPVAASAAERAEVARGSERGGGGSGGGGGGGADADAMLRPLLADLFGGGGDSGGLSRAEKLMHEIARTDGPTVSRAVNHATGRMAGAVSGAAAQLLAPIAAAAPGTSAAVSAASTAENAGSIVAAFKNMRECYGTVCEQKTKPKDITDSMISRAYLWIEPLQDLQQIAADMKTCTEYAHNIGSWYFGTRSGSKTGPRAVTGQTSE
jgi:hypothetical protein